MALHHSVIWVVDTSSLIGVKQQIRREFHEETFSILADLCTDKLKLVYPKEALTELENGSKRGVPDAPLNWANKNANVGCRFGPCNNELRTVMSHSVANLTTEPGKLGIEDHADPHILALALTLEASGFSPVVVTEESRKPHPQVP